METSTTSTSDEPVSVREFDSGILTNRDGEVILNTMQQDLIGIRKVFADGTVEFWARPARGGEPRLIIERFSFKDGEPKCRHCGKAL